jgi:hypothetical protein
MASEWWIGFHADVRWRMWLLTRLALQCDQLPGNHAEFGVYRAGCAFMLLATTAPRADRKLYLFDTFAGIPDAELSDNERSLGLSGSLSDTSAEYVARRLDRWRGRYEIVAGDVFETLRQFDTGRLAFVHIDVNSRAATRHVLEYSYERLVPHGVFLFDDYGYGWEESRELRTSVDDFFSSRAETVVALPTGQAFVTKQSS